MEHRAERKKSRRDAFTLAEFLVVISITMILAGVSFVAAIRYQSRLRRMEMDRTAKEIFLTAQNNLSLAKSGGIMERLLAESSGSEEKVGTPVSGETEDGLYAVLYQPGENGQNENEEIRERLLPFGSIDETVRTDGSYLIVYDPAAGAVRRVWYSDRYIFQGTATEYAELLTAAQDPEARERFQGEAIGYYAGDSMTEPDVQPVQPGKLSLKIHNGAILYAEVESQSSASSLKLWIEGVTSGAKGWIDLNAGSRDGRVLTIGTGGVHYVILDDISLEKGRFANLRQDLQSSDGGNELPLIPGEDIRIYAEAVSGSSTARSTVYQTNSLFQDITSDKVLVSSIRHLENLDYRISAFNPDRNAGKLGLSASQEQPGAYVVSQQRDLSWTGYRQQVCEEIHRMHGTAAREETNISVYYMTEEKQGTDVKEVWAKTNNGCYAPVEPQFSMIYEGNTHEIQDLLVSRGDGAGGCFGTVKKDLSVSRLTLVRPVITAKSGAGALIGFGQDAQYLENPQSAILKISLEDIQVQYPMIRSTGKKYATSTDEVDAGALIGAFNGKELTVKRSVAANTYRKTVLGTSVGDLAEAQESAYEIQSDYGAAGGLIGSVGGSVTISGCAAAVYVDAQGYAGGLIANVKTIGGLQNVTIESSYVGGHTSGGKFLIHPTPSEGNFEGTAGRYNVVSRKEVAGGLAAVLPEGSKVAHTYVTTSVYIYSDAYGEVPDAAETRDTGNENAGNQESGNQNTGTQSEPQMQAGFVTMYGNVNAGGQSASTVSGKKASEFSYCYSASMVNGAKTESWDAALNSYFDGTSFTGSAKAFPYDKTLAAVYPMPTVIQLVKADPAAKDQIQQEAGSEAASQPKNFSKFSRVHLGDWVKVEAEEDEQNGLTYHNGNELWVDYVMDMPTGTETKFLTFSVYGESSRLTKYVILKIDANLDQLKYFGSNNASEIQELRENPENDSIRWRWNAKYTVNGEDHRFLISKTGTSQVRIRFYLDSKAFKQMGYQNLRDGFQAGEYATITASEKNAIPDASDPEIRVNSYFGELYEERNAVEVSNSRHLINLSFYDKNNFKITTVEQTDNILWQKDKDELITANTAPYCEELTEAYPGVPVSIFNNDDNKDGYTEAGSFKCIENADLTLYNGNHHTIVGLKIGVQKHYMQWRNASAFIVANEHLKVQDLDMKDLQVEGSGTAAGILAFADGNSANGTYLRLENIRIYGDSVHITAGNNDNGNIGGVVAYANVEDLQLNQVYFYGREALVDKSAGVGGQYMGGLIGYAQIGKSMTMKQSMFSGVVDGSLVGTGAWDGTGGTGGLIGYLSVSDAPNQKASAQITECYVSGRTGEANGKDGITITGRKIAGSFIGRGTGPLKIERSFSTAGVYASESGSCYGGLIGKYEKSSGLSMNQCYYAGRIRKSSYEKDIYCGYLIGATDYDSHTVDYVTKPDVPRIGTWSNVLFVRYPDTDGLKMIGTSSADNRVPGDITACTFTDPNSMKALKPRGTEAGYENLQTHAYDSELQGKSYPYRIWTTEDGVKTYRGDWIQ